MKNNITITIRVDGIRSEIMNIISSYDIQIVDNESGNFFGSDELSIMADAFTILQVVESLYRRYGNDLDFYIKTMQDQLQVNISQLMSYVMTHFEATPTNNNCHLHRLSYEQCCQLVEDSKDPNIILEINDELAFPLYKNNIIYYGKTCELITILLILYHSNNVDVKRLVLLFTLIDINIKGKNSSNIHYLLTKLDKEATKFYKRCRNIEDDIYADAVTYFQLKHEKYHIKLKKQPDLLERVIEYVKEMSVAYNSDEIGNGCRQQWVRTGINEIFQSEHWQHELACDWYSIIETIHFMILSNYSVENIRDAIKQILRVLAMTQSIKHISVISKFSIRKYKKAINNQTFDTFRVANIINAILHSKFVDICDSAIVESFVSEMRKYGKDTLGATLKIGLSDLGILATASIDPTGLNSKEDILPELLHSYSQLCDILRSVILLRTCDTN